MLGVYTIVKPAADAAFDELVGKEQTDLRIRLLTAVVPAPAAIVAGLKAQLLNAGNPEHAKLTVELNAAPPTGTAENG